MDPLSPGYVAPACLWSHPLPDFSPVYMLDFPGVHAGVRLPVHPAGRSPLSSGPRSLGSPLGRFVGIAAPGGLAGHAGCPGINFLERSSMYSVLGSIAGDPHWTRLSAILCLQTKGEHDNLVVESEDWQ
jgi:hypothetical protein